MAIPLALAIAGDPKRLISTFTALETAIVIEAKKGESGGRELYCARAQSAGFILCESGFQPRLSRQDAAPTKAQKVTVESIDLLRHQARIEMAPLTAEQFEIAQLVWRRYGKGRYPAGLHIGDCCASTVTNTFDGPTPFSQLFH